MVNLEIKDKKRIKRALEEFEERGNNYFKRCNKEKIEPLKVLSKEQLGNTDEFEMLHYNL